MIFMLNPVSPLASATPDVGGGTPSSHVPQEEQEEPEVDFSQAMLDDPIVGTALVTMDHNGPGALRPKPLPSHKQMTPAEKEAHDLTHVKFDPACEICQATRGVNAQHRSVVEHNRVIPLLVAGYCYLRFAGSTLLRTVLVMRLYPYRMSLA